MRWYKTPVTPLVTMVLIGQLASAHAQQNDAKDDAKKDGDRTPKVKIERSASGQKVYRITEGIVVEGRLQKPNAFYVLQRSSIDYDWETLQQGFLHKILQATGQRPF